MGTVVAFFTIGLGCLSFIFHIGNQDHQTRFWNIADIYIQNTSSNPIPLYNSKKPRGKPIGTLKSNDIYLFSYAGSSGKWLHGQKDGKEVFIKDDARQKVLVVRNQIIPLQTASYGSGTGALLLSLLFIPLGIRSKVKQKKRRIAQENFRLQEHNKKEALIQHQRNEKEAIYRENLQLKQELVNLKNTTHLQLNTSEKAREQRKKELDQLEKALRLRIEQEANLRTHVKVAEMQASYDRIHNQYESLKEKYNRCINEGILFDIDFEGKEYENILKGRKFEIFFAKKLLQDKDFEILEWTSDKGGKSDIQVKSNNNPDFVIGYKNTMIFAVECKYREKVLQGGKAGTRISWCSTRQSEHYTTFGNERKIPVYIALGLRGQAEKPEQSYLIALNTLKPLSLEEKIKARAEQLTVKPMEISKYELALDNFPEQVLNRVNAR